MANPVFTGADVEAQAGYLHEVAHWCYMRIRRLGVRQVELLASGLTMQWVNVDVAYKVFDSM